MSIFDLGPKTGDSESTSYLPSQKKALNKAIDVYQPTLGQGQDVYQGDRIAPMTTLQQQALGQAGDFLGAFQTGQPTPMSAETGGALSGLLSGTAGAQQIDQGAANDYFSRVYEQPAVRNYQEITNPAVQEAYAGPGYWGSARAGAQAGAAQDLANWLGETRGQFDWDVMQQNRAGQESKANRQLQAVPQGMAYGQQPTQIAQQQLQGTKDVFAMAGQQQLQQQAQIDADIQKFIEQGRLTNPEDLNTLLALIGQGMSKTDSVSYAKPADNFTVPAQMAAAIFAA